MFSDMNQSSQRAAFLDRDGTLNVEKGYLRQVDDLVLIPGVAQAVRRLNDAGVLAVLTTNQTGAARGFYGVDHIHALHARLETLLRDEADARLDAIFYCPHLEKGVVPEYALSCQCRKPGTGMVENAVRRFPAIDLAQSFVLGDKASDVTFGHNAGCTAILLKTGYGARVLAGQYQTLTHPPHQVFEALPDAIDWILRQPA
jgi:D-glycero-D-manno-heptose 1,7-bisphosphate phosphatase